MTEPSTTRDLGAENAAWKQRLATCGWDGYIVVIAGTLYRASKIVAGVGVELAGDDQESVFAMAEHIGGPAV